MLNRILVAGTSILAVVIISCSSDPVSRESYGAASDSPGAITPPTPLTPKGQKLSPDAKAIVRSIVPGGPAERCGVRVGDLIIKLNAAFISSAGDLEFQSRMAPRDSLITVKRGLKSRVFNIHLENSRPRLGLSIEPMGVSVIRPASPMISSIHRKNMTVHAEASVNEDKTELHVNFIIESTKFEPTTLAQLLVSDEHGKKTLLRSQESIDSLGAKPYVLSRKIHRDDIKTPIQVSLNVSDNNFVFEFQ